MAQGADREKPRVLEELEEATRGRRRLPETNRKFEHLKAQIAQSELIVAATKAKSPGACDLSL